MRPILSCCLLLALTSALYAAPVAQTQPGAQERAQLLYRIAERRLREGRLISRSLGQLEEASRLTPSDSRVWEVLACGYVARALELVWMTTPEGVSLAQSRENRAIVQSGKPINTYTAPLVDKAVAALEKALKLDPARSAELQHTLGWVWLVDLRQGLSDRREEAAEKAGKALAAAAKAVPSSARYHQSLGDYYRALAAAQISPPEEGSASTLSVEARGRQEYETALRLDPRNAGLHYLLYTFALEGPLPNREEARRHLESARQADPGNGLYDYLMAGLDLDRGREDEKAREETDESALSAMVRGNQASWLSLTVYRPSPPACLSALLQNMVTGQPTDLELPLLNRLTEIGRAALTAAKRWETERPSQALAAYTTLVAMGEHLAQAAMSGFSGILRLTQISGALELQRAALAPLTQWVVTYGTPAQLAMVRQKQQELDALTQWLEEAILRALPEEMLDDTGGAPAPAPQAPTPGP